MKKLIAAMFFVLTINISHAQELKETDLLTLQEQKVMCYAKEKLYQAEQNLKNVQDKIAKDHKMQERDFIGWKQYYVIDGNKIMRYMKENTIVDLQKGN